MGRESSTMQSIFIQRATKKSEYVVILNPPEELRRKIAVARDSFRKKYQIPNNPLAKPYLTLARFSQVEFMEERIMNRLKLIAMAHRPFLVELRDFGSYPAHTIFINVATRQPIKDLIRVIKPLQKLLTLDSEHKPYVVDEPVFTLGRRLKPWQFNQAWAEYSSRHFTARFVADSFLLLKKAEGEKSYMVAGRYDFQNLPIATVQGELFL